MIELLLEQPLLLLFVVAGLGYLLGEVNVKGSSLGVAAVLFAGLGVGALHPDLRLPEIVSSLGLVLFVYTIGLSSGPSFFASFQRKGLRDNLMVLGLLAFASALLVGVHMALALEPEVSVGLFTGSLTNTAALAGVLEYLKAEAPPATLAAALDAPVVGYSLGYPVGVIGVILALAFVQRLWKVDYAREAEDLRELGATNTGLTNRTIRVTRPEATTQPLEALVRAHGWDVQFGRMRSGGRLSVTDPQLALAVGDLVSVIGTPEDLDRITAFLGETGTEQLALDRSEFDFRRIFVSNPRVAGRRLRDLDLFQQFGAVVTRVRRGDVEWLAHEDTTLELGDRVRVVAARESLPVLGRFLGDSYRALSEINVVNFSFGILLGILVGLVPIPFFGGTTFKLGTAGGPLVVGLILGRLERTGPVVWHLPYSGNLLLRQVGLVLFFAGVGTRAGHAFFTTLTGAGGAVILAGGAVVTCGTALATLWVGYRVFKIPLSLLSGILSGLHTQPAVLSYALKQSGNDLPNIGYATVFPVATIAKILIAQLLLILLS